MDMDLTEEARIQVQRFCRQYLQLESHLDYPDGQYLRENSVQEMLFERLWNPKTQSHPRPLRYELRTLQKLVAQIESSIEDWDEHGIHEGLMDIMSVLLNQPMPSELAAAQQRAYVTYTLSGLGSRDGTREDSSDETILRDAPTITLLEARTILSAHGTTGLSTWVAALHLGAYLCREQNLVRGRHVLELGAGTGYLSILCARYLGAASVLATDGSDDVINNLPESFYLNGLEESQSDSMGATLLCKTMELKWGHALLGTEEAVWNGGRPVDVVLGADITYDASVIPMLLATLTDLALLFPRVTIIVAATERNQATFATFLGTAVQSGFSVDEISFPLQPRPQQTGPFYNDAVPIHICQLRQKIG